MSGSVTISIATNSVIAASKFFGYLVTGSPTLFAETIHSCADVGNQVLLKVGEVRGAREATEEHPFGHSQEKFFWALVSAVSVFFIGCGVTLYHGIHSLMHPDKVEPFTPLAIGLLVFSLLLEIFTFYTALKEIGGFRQIWANRSNTTVLAVLLEDGVAVLGILLTLLVVAVSTFGTPNPLFDAIVSIAVGIILGAMAIFLAAINRRLLIDSADSELNQDVEARLRSDGITADVSSLVLDVDRYVLFIRVNADVMPGDHFRHSFDLGEQLKAFYRDQKNKTIDAVYWKFPVSLR